MKKKFKVRVRHYCKTSYVVEYAHYYIFKNWKIIYQFLESYNDYCFNPILEDCNHIIDIAKNFESIEDVRKHYATQNQREIDWRNRRVPYCELIVKTCS